MKILYGTCNHAKIVSMKRRLKTLNIDIYGLEDMIDKGFSLPEIEETGNTPLENAVQKAVAYYKAFKVPVFSCDSGLYFDNVSDNEQPGIHVRRVNGRYLSDEEMVEYYSDLSKKYNGLTARYRNAICFIKDEAHIYSAMDTDMESAKFIITSVPHKIKEKGFPLDSLSKDIKTGKYFYDMDDSEIDKIAVEDGFIRFFKDIKGGF